ncbi:MAG: thrombospondin type 3 repeat-containing protein [Archangium sp.]
MINRTSLIAAALFASTAFASADYPGEIMTKYGLSGLPPQLCSLCHPNGSGGTGTATAPMAIALQSRGLTSGNAASLRMALDRLEADMVDSDGDGVIDVEELKAGTDPNKKDVVTDGGTGGGGGTTVIPALKYGCGANISPELFFLVLLAPLARRRLRR